MRQSATVPTFHWLSKNLQNAFCRCPRQRLPLVSLLRLLSRPTQARSPPSQRLLPNLHLRLLLPRFQHAMLAVRLFVFLTSVCAALANLVFLSLLVFTVDPLQPEYWFNDLGGTDNSKLCKCGTFSHSLIYPRACQWWALEDIGSGTM